MRKISLSVFFGFLLVRSPLAGQGISVGVIGGVSPGPEFSGYDHGKRYLAGASLEFEIGRNFSLELDGMYRPQPLYGSNGSWQVPVLTKYRLHWGRISPFIEAGPSFRKSGISTRRYAAYFGVTGGAGVSIPIKRLSVEPTVRFAHWGKDGYTPTDRLEFLVGVNSALTKSANWTPIASRVSIGALLGVPFTDEYKTIKSPFLIGTTVSTNVSESGPRSALVGAAVELHVVQNLYFEADGFDRPLRIAYSNTFYLPTPSVYTDVTWQFLALAKYKFTIAGMSPFVEMGPAFRLPHNVPGTTPYGAAVGAGVERKFGPVTLSPRIRWSHWSRVPIGSNNSLNRNEVVFLSGISVGGGPK